MSRPRLIGINHVALEVADIDAALDFYGAIFSFELRGRARRMAFLDMGDQFIALSAGRTQPADHGRHFGLVVDDLEATRAALAEAGVQPLPGRGLDFMDPWGNRIQVVDYREIQFTKTAGALGALGAGALQKSARARGEIESRGLAEPPA